jgi:hypothetical protein
VADERTLLGGLVSVLTPLIAQFPGSASGGSGGGVPAALPLGSGPVSDRTGVLALTGALVANIEGVVIQRLIKNLPAPDLVPDLRASPVPPPGTPVTPPPAPIVPTPAGPTPDTLVTPSGPPSGGGPTPSASGPGIAIGAASGASTNRIPGLPLGDGGRKIFKPLVN